MFRTEDGAIVGSINVAELSEEERVELGLTEPETEAPESEDLSKLLKSELVAQAEAAGLDPTGLKKADLVAALESNETDDEEVDDGDDSISS